MGVRVPSSAPTEYNPSDPVAPTPFSVRSFRFQWPADLAASWAFEMEALILGWFVLVETGSVQQLALLGALVWAGSLLSPFLGILGDRIGFRALLCLARGLYVALAATLALLVFTRTLAPWHVFALATIGGLVRPSDMMVRNVLIGQTMHPSILLGALGISRTTSDTARIVGALAGTGSVALIGMGSAYLLVTAIYAAAFLLSFGVAASPPRVQQAGASASSAVAVLDGLKQAVRYVYHVPDQLAAFSIAFIVNLLAFPFVFGLLPYIAKEVLGAGQTGLGYLAAAFSTGALAGSLFVGSRRLPLRAGRAMLAGGAAWFAALLMFGQVRSLEAGIACLFFAGLAQSLCLVPLAAVMLRSSSEEMRGRVMGMRNLAVWGLPLGLVAAGPIVERFGYGAMAFAYAGLGLAAMLVIGYRWRSALWVRSALANH